MRTTCFLGLLILASCQPVSPADDTDSDAPADTDAPAEFDVLDPSACVATEAFDGHGFDAAYTAPHTDDLLADRLFPLLTVLGTDPAARAALDADPALVALSARKRAGLDDARTCGADAACVSEALLLGTDDAAVARAQLVKLFGGVSSPIVDAHLKPSGVFMRWAGSSNEVLIGSAWDDALLHGQALIQAHVLGLSPTDRDALLVALDASLADDVPWFVPMQALASAGLRQDGRDEAARYEPIDQGENAAALARLPSLHWDRWRFAAILIPGQGPTDAETALNPASAARADVAVARWRAGLAPFLMPSGGHVHPDRTVYSEAIEMKRYLMETYDVPEDAILVDPYARHTTTNLRDVTRMLLRYGMPVDAPVLVTSDTLQSAYIATLLAPRCQAELGYVPWRAMAALTPNDSCVRASPEVLFLDPSDPLDP